MDDRFYLAVYDQKRLKKLLVEVQESTDVGGMKLSCADTADTVSCESGSVKSSAKNRISVISKENYVCEIVLPGYEACEIQVPGKDGGKAYRIKGICRSRFAETPASLYKLDERVLPALDQNMAPELVRHQAMAADDERLYNVYVYVSEQETEGSNN